MKVDYDYEKYELNRKSIELWLKKDEWQLYQAACILSDVVPNNHLEKVLTGRGVTRLKQYTNLKGETFDSNTNEKGVNYSLRDLLQKETEIRDFLSHLGRVRVAMNPDSEWVALKENFIEVALESTKKIPWYQWALKNNLIVKKVKSKVNNSDLALKTPQNSKLNNFNDIHNIYNQLHSNVLLKNINKYPIELKFAIQAWQAVSASEGKGKPKARIKKWLNENTNLSNEAKNRISIVVNWDKAGGATKMD